MGKDFVLDDGGIVVDENKFDGEGRDLSEKDAAEGIGDRCVNAYEGKGGVVGGVFVELDLEVLVERKHEFIVLKHLGVDFMRTSENFVKLQEWSSPG